MKKYSDEHLEKVVTADFVVGLEKALRNINIHVERGSTDTCPMKNIGLYFECYDGDFNTCSDVLSYGINNYVVAKCPCYQFGKTASIAMMKNLVKQWKAWAGLVG